MRRRLAWVFVALAVMLAVGFLVPLGRSVKSQAELRALAGAQSDARGVATALAAVVTTTGRTPAAADAAFIISSFETQNIVILLPDDTLVGGGVPVEDLRAVAKDGSIMADVDGGVVVEMRCPVERRRTVDLRGVRVGGALGQRRADRVDVPCLDQLEELLVGGCGGQAHARKGRGQ